MNNRIARLRDGALHLAESCPAPRRRQELQAIAANCRRVPAEPPRNFWEACQCLWFAFHFLPDAPGRVDQYLDPQCQFNLLNREMLLEAKRNPEQHRDLMVRVSGYSAPFVSLWDDLQDEILARTMQNL